MATVVFLGVYLIDLGFGFEGSFQRLGDYKFISATLTGGDAQGDLPNPPG